MDNNIKHALMVSNIQNELETYIQRVNLKSLVLGISGGIDSALCAAIARPVCDKLGIPLIGRSIPITTNTSDERDRAELVGKAFCTDFEESYQIEGAFGAIWDAIKQEGWDAEDPYEKIRMGNVKARIRMIALYDLARLHNGMVLSTDNYTELLLGFWTLHGDVGDYGMLQNLWKTEVYEIAEYLVRILGEDQSKALRSCIVCQATDGLGISKTDLDQILPGWKGSSRDGYAEVDKILFSYLVGVKEIDEKPIEEHPVVERHLKTEFKRDNPYNIPREKILPQ
jgi:NAD+ synthase